MVNRSLIKVRGERDDNEYYTSDKYLKKIDKKNHEGFPEKTHGIDLVFCDSTDNEIRKRIRKIDLDYSDRRRNYYKRLKTFSTFGKGWLRRVEETELEALKLAGVYLQH